MAVAEKNFGIDHPKTAIIYSNLASVLKGLGDNEGAIMQEMQRALYGQDYEIYDFYTGVGGKDVPPISIEKILYMIKNRHNDGGQQLNEVNWIDIDN